jgi:hypothetical protein
VQLDSSATKNKMSRHTSHRKSLNFYPTALFAFGVFAITHCTHLLVAAFGGWASPTTSKKVQSCQRTILCLLILYWSKPKIF